MFAGISGVGKSTLIEKLAASFSLEHLQASALIKEGRHAVGEMTITQDQLRFVDIDENQNLLIQEFINRTRESTGLIVLDGHTIIERGDALTRIDARVFGAIGIAGMVFLTDDVEAIAQRRLNDPGRKRAILGVDRLRHIQAEARAHAGAVCRALDISLQVYRPNEIAPIAHALQRLAEPR
jgi:adenylate kinase